MFSRHVVTLDNGILHAALNTTKVLHIGETPPLPPSPENKTVLCHSTKPMEYPTCPYLRPEKLYLQPLLQINAERRTINKHSGGQPENNDRHDETKTGKINKQTKIKKHSAE